MNLLNRINTWLKAPHSRAILAGAVLLAILAVLQVNQMQRNVPMVPLLEECELSGNDLERMQFALGKAGLSDFAVKDGQLMVSQKNHGAYLQAIAEADAIPLHLRDDEPTVPSINPFMSRSQQRLIAENEKKRQIREMVTRLPFVQQAWFEMDTADGGNAFEPSRQSAVVSIKPPSGMLLDGDQVATLRQMIGGALAGIDPTNIVVIDVSAGYAHQDRSTGAPFQSVSIDQRPALEQKSHYTNRVREALGNLGSQYADIDIDVQVEMIELKKTPVPAAFVSTPRETKQSMAVMGTNGVASIYDQAQPVAKAPVQLIPAVEYDSRITVALNVPQSIIDRLPNTFVPAAPAGSVTRTPTREAKFQRLSQELIGCVRPVMPNSSFQRNAPFPVSINMVREPVQVAATWQDTVRAFFTKHWPSLAVLGIGLLLISTISRKTVPTPVETNEQESQDIVSINSPIETIEPAASTEPLPDAKLAEPEDYAKRDAERKLNRLFEKDPDSAAKVIESWIRDAA